MTLALKYDAVKPGFTLYPLPFTRCLVLHLVDPGAFPPGATNRPTADWLADTGSVETFKFFAWHTSIAAAPEAGAAVSVLYHPDIPAIQDHIIYQDHVPTTNGTAGYADVRKFLGVLKAIVVSTLCIPLVFVLGDQQSFSRMVWLKRKEPDAFGFVIPFYGDFHFAVHLLMAMHSLWWGPLVSWLLQETGFCSQSIHQEWSSVELYNRYRFVYEAIIVGILAYLLEVLPEGALNDPGPLLEAASTQNKGKWPTVINISCFAFTR